MADPPKPARAATGGAPGARQAGRGRSTAEGPAPAPPPGLVLPSQSGPVARGTPFVQTQPQPYVSPGMYGPGMPSQDREDVTPLPVAAPMAVTMMPAAAVLAAAPPVLVPPAPVTVPSPVVPAPAPAPVASAPAPMPVAPMPAARMPAAPMPAAPMPAAPMPAAPMPAAPTPSPASEPARPPPSMRWIGSPPGADAGDSLDHLATTPGRHRDEIAAAAPPEIAIAPFHLSSEAALDPRLVLLRAPDSEQAASFRVLRHQLGERGSPRLLVVTSARQGDGKTTCAVNVALALGECGRSRVLLVEANLRRPALANLFGFTPPWCFGEQIAAHRGDPRLAWSVVEISTVGLHVAAVDGRTARGMLLDTLAFSIAMERLRRADYQHVIIDAPAVLGSAEVNLIQDAADAVLLVTRAGRTRARELRRAIEQIGTRKLAGFAHVEV